MCQCNSSSSYTYPNGVTSYMFQNPSNSCGCSSPVTDCSAAPCPIQLDASCTLYHKFNNLTSGLVNTSLSNGATLDLILEVFDGYLGQITNVKTYTLTYLRQKYVINTLQQFLEAVDIELSSFNDQITALDSGSGTTNNYLGSFTSDPGAAVNGNMWYNTNQNKLKIKTNGIVKEILTA